MNISESLEARSIPEPNTGCWLWIGCAYPDGYGRLILGGKEARAHCESYRANVGPIPRGLVVMHSCDTPACINPAHLSVGTNLDNVADRHRKGRDARGDRNGARLHPETRRGSRNGRAKLSAEDVANVRAALGRGDRQVDIAARFGVKQSAISKIKRGALWNWVAR